MSSSRWQGALQLLRWMWRAQWRTQPGRAAIAIAAIAIGVALALSIELVNRSALDEFASAIAVTEGRAQAQLRARARSFDETLYARFARDEPQVEASPVVEADFPLAGRPGESLRVIGIDVFRAAEVTPALLPQPADTDDAGGASALFDDDTIFLSNTALSALSLTAGDRLRLLAGGEVVSLRVAGTVPGVGSGQPLAVMDLGTMQWRLGWLGRLTRIDLRFPADVDAGQVRSRWEAKLGSEAIWTTPDAGRERASGLSLAYRVNLNVLALVALFTGGFIVHSTLALAVARQHRELALLDVLGAGHRLLFVQVLGQGLLLGGIGALIGAAGGIALAAMLLAWVGGDLGGGYFSGSPAALSLDARSVSGFAGAGVLTALAGSLAPALAVQRLPAARALRSGGVEETLRSRRPLAWPLAWFALGAVLLALPVRSEVPWLAYGAIGAWLLGAIAWIPRIVASVARMLASLDTSLARGPLRWLAVHRLRGAQHSASAAISGIVASYALAVSMAVMVTSFRTSVDHWLDIVLPADAYVRIASGALMGAIDPALQRRIADSHGVTQVEFLRTIEWNLRPERPPVTLMIRPIDAAQPGNRLAILGAVHRAPSGSTPIYVSEAMVDLYGLEPGKTARLALPLASAPGGGAGTSAPHGAAAVPIPGGAAAESAQAPLFVAAVWRDYGRQHGSIVIDSADWRRIGGDETVSDAAVWFDASIPHDEAVSAMRDTLADVAGAQLRTTGELRATSLRIFDRSFAVTYALEAIAILVALFGVASTWATEGIARRREFGVLRQLGLRSTEIARLFAIEALLQIAIAIAWGAVLGTAIALVLIHRVNPQSFHWTMEFVWPGGLLAASAAALLALGTLAAVLAARHALGTPTRALAEDW